MGGGDLDGDIVSNLSRDTPLTAHSKIQYNITSLHYLPIRRTCQAAAYTDAPKKILDRKCTMSDVADFVTDYINSDVRVFIMEVYCRPTFCRFWALSRENG